MARARNIKPGFFQNEELVELPFEYRLLFIGLWTIADREGRLEDRPKRIKMAVFPADNVDVDEGLNQLQAAGVLTRYEAGDIKAIQIINFAKHQNPHVKEAASTIPEPSGFICNPERAQDENDASTVLAPDENDASHADSLIPESLCLQPPQRASDGDRFSIGIDWTPSEHFRTLTKQAGLPMPGSNEFNACLAEFKSYWISRMEKRTQNEWDHALIRSMKSEKLRSARAPNARASPGFVSQRDQQRQEVIEVLTGKNRTHERTEPAAIDAECQRLAG